MKEKYVMFVGEVFLEQIARAVRTGQDLINSPSFLFGDLSTSEKFDSCISCLNHVQRISQDALNMLSEMYDEYTNNTLPENEEEEQEKLDVENGATVLAENEEEAPKNPTSDLATSGE